MGIDRLHSRKRPNGSTMVRNARKSKREARLTRATPPRRPNRTRRTATGTNDSDDRVRGRPTSQEGQHCHSKVANCNRQPGSTERQEIQKESRNERTTKHQQGQQGHRRSQCNSWTTDEHKHEGQGCQGIYLCPRFSTKANKCPQANDDLQNQYRWKRTIEWTS